jgi:hypothetical protein
MFTSQLQKMSHQEIITWKGLYVDYQFCLKIVAATSEYCKDFGVSYEIESFLKSLDLIKKRL